MMRRLTQRFGRLIPSTAIALAVTAALVSLAGCGGGDSSTTGGNFSQTASITKAELIKKGDAICRKTDTVQTKSVEAYVKKHGEAANPKELAETLAIVAPPPIKAEIDELSALGAPEGEEAKISAIIDGLENALKETEEEPASLVSVSEGFFVKPGDLAGKYGFKDCAEPL